MYSFSWSVFWSAIWPKYGEGFGETQITLKENEIWRLPGKQDSPKFGHGMDRKWEIGKCESTRRASRQWCLLPYPILSYRLSTSSFLPPFPSASSSDGGIGKVISKFQSKGPIFGFRSNWSFLTWNFQKTKNEIPESNEKKCGMRDFREKGAGIRDEDKLMITCKSI